MENEILKVLREVILHLRLHCEGPITERHSMEVMEECADKLEREVLNPLTILDIDGQNCEESKKVDNWEVDTGRWKEKNKKGVHHEIYEDQHHG